MRRGMWPAQTRKVPSRHTGTWSLNRAIPVCGLKVSFLSSLATYLLHTLDFLVLTVAFDVLAPINTKSPASNPVYIYT
jgi:hypothetical protein